MNGVMLGGVKNAMTSLQHELSRPSLFEQCHRELLFCHQYKALRYIMVFASPIVLSMSS